MGHSLFFSKFFNLVLHLFTSCGYSLKFWTYFVNNFLPKFWTLL
nr:MAG TPA: hypothetical protein [Caudoviricetes sp.]